MFKRKYWEIHNLFSPVEKVVMRTDRNGEEVAKTISYRQQFIDSAVFMASSLSNLVDNTAKGIHKIKRKNCNTSCIDYTNAKDDLIEYQCLCCNKDYQKRLMKRWKLRFANHDINKITLLLQKKCLSIWIHE